jgi:hypothetical protein
MPVRIEMDVYSGRENPTWELTNEEAQQLKDRIAAEPTIVSDVQSTDGRLGYRGYVVSLLEEPEETAAFRLPSRFRVGGSASPNVEIAEFLLKTTEKADAEVSDWLREYAHGVVQDMKAKPTDDQGVGPRSAQSFSSQALGAGMSCSVNYLTSSSDFSFWNASQYINANNCYNFASNYRTNTFAQPGRRANQTFKAYTADAFATALHADGWADYCLGGTARNISAALVIWPTTIPGGPDFHFYRLCSGGLWCHKPGKSAARNFDNSGNLIYNPQYCNRGNYVTFVGFIHGNSYVQVL